VAPADGGDAWTWTALDRDSKLIISYLIDGRDVGYAQEFVQDVAARVANRNFANPAQGNLSLTRILIMSRG